MQEKTYATPSGTIHYWVHMATADIATLAFLPGLTADHRLFEKQIEYFKNRYNVLVWDPPERTEVYSDPCQEAVPVREAE